MATRPRGRWLAVSQPRLHRPTGRANYKSLGDTIGVDIEANPDQLFDPEVSLAIAAAFWSSRRLNDPADADDITGVTRGFNGGLNGLADRQRLLDLAKQTFGAAD